MILGLGTDLCRVSRIEQSLEQYGKRFEKRVFTPGEIDYCRRRSESAVHFAARFAAKEAAYKALGTGLSMGVRWKDVEVTRLPGKRPNIQLSGRADQLAREMGVTGVHLSLTHEGDHALAVVVIEGL